jgi:hypothetical protein
MKDERAKKIEEAIKLIYDSLDSHLEWTHRQSSEYAQLILILTQLY